MENIYENKELCAKCKGKCCKKGGCQYAPSDFESIKYSYLLEKLKEGYISIVCVLDFAVLGGKVIPKPYLYVKSRNTGRDIIDLVSLRTKCLCLTDSGCMYDFSHRPSGGVNLIPDQNGCYPEKDPMEFIMMWQPHQDVLRKLVRQISGKTVEQKLSEDVQQLFTDLLEKNFNGVDKEELTDVLSNINRYILAFPNEYKKAKAQYNLLRPQNNLRTK